MLTAAVIAVVVSGAVVVDVVVVITVVDVVTASRTAAFSSLPIPLPTPVTQHYDASCHTYHQTCFPFSVIMYPSVLWL